MKQEFDQDRIKVNVCFDARSSVALGTDSKLIEALSYLMRTYGYFVSDRHLLPLIVKAAVSARNKVEEDEKFVYKFRYLPTRREFLDLFKILKRLEEELRDKQDKKSLLERRISLLKQGILEPEVNQVSNETVASKHSSSIILMEFI